MRKPCCFLALALLFSLSPFVASAACAPPPPVQDETKKVDTEGALGRFKQLIGVNLSVSVATERKTVLAAYPNADQLVFALTAIFNLCSMLEATKELTIEQKIDRLLVFQTQMMARVGGPQPISSTAPARQAPLPPSRQLGDQRKSDWNVEQPHVAFMMLREAGMRAQKPSWADIYLNTLPLLITDKNKYFVIVGSAPNEAQGEKKMKELKARHPEYDFELFGPYGSNTSYGIMIASWVSRERAAEALQAAKKIEPTSFIWSCRGTGDAC